MRQKAFTLIEVVVTLIIVGILTSISLPMIFSRIERHQAQRAIHIMNTIRVAIESCGADNNFLYNTNCQLGGATIWTALSLADPSDAYFTYSYSGTDASGGSTGGYIINASRSGDTIQIIKDSTNGQVSCAGTGKYFGFC